MTVRHWSALSPDPNSAQAIEQRRSQLRLARRPPVASRDDHFVEAARGRRVLDIGCVDHLPIGAALAPLHRQLLRSAQHLVGVDIASEGIDTLKREGLEVHVADATSPGLVDVVGTGYDLVCAGEVIEHLVDLSEFFANIRQVLAPKGELLLSTPNPHALHLALHNMAGRPVDNVDHVVYHWPSGIAEIADRFAFKLLEIRGERRLYRKKHLPVFTLGRTLSAFGAAGNIECITLIYRLAPSQSKL